MNNKKTLDTRKFYGLLLLSGLFLMSGMQFAFAHGTVTSPASRVWNCYLENPENPTSAACIAAVASHGSQPLYDWNEINQGNADGNHTAVVPDGNLPSGGRPDKYGGMDQVRTDWVATPVTPGAFTVTWTNSAPHATAYYDVYITNADWTPDQPLTWSSLTLLVRTDPSPAEATVDIPVTLPARTGKHIIYSVWQRSDSPEAFYSTSDVDFGTVLPVELGAFEAEVSGKNDVELTWTTFSETNSAFFAVEHSTDGINFTETGKIPARGTTTETQYYNFTDYAAANGKNYYRLRETNLDGTFAYSRIKTVTITSDDVITVYPTVTRDFIQINLQKSTEDEIPFRILDLTGKRVQAAAVKAGTDFLRFSVGDLPRGTYFIRFELNGSVITKQFMKM